MRTILNDSNGRQDWCNSNASFKNNVTRRDNGVSSQLRSCSALLVKVVRIAYVTRQNGSNYNGNGGRP